MNFAIKTFNELTIDELYEIVKSRFEVFVCEQKIVEDFLRLLCISFVYTVPQKFFADVVKVWHAFIRCRLILRKHQLL